MISDKRGEKILRWIKTIPYNKMHCKRVHKVIKRLEPSKGKLPKTIKRLCDDYSTEVLGWKGYAPWLYFYSLVYGKFKEGWIPDSYYADVVMPILKGKYGTLSGMKSLVHRIFKSPNFPDILYYANGRFLSTELEVIPEKDVKKILFAENERVVFKKDNSLRGLGVFSLGSADFDISMIREHGSGVFQGFIDQHEFFGELVHGPVSTIRITTVCEPDSKISVRSSLLRVGREGESHVRSSSQIRISVDVNNGELSSLGYFPDWNTIEKHPDTGFVFGGKVIPFFRRCTEIVIELHKKMPQVISVGWDLGVDRKGEVKVMEWNSGHNGIAWSEAVDGPCFADLGWEDLWRKN